MSILSKSITDCHTLQEISDWRTEKEKIDKKSGDDYTGILTNIYKEPTHFIYELLQNADDAKAVNVKFVLSLDKIEFFHDGSAEFTLSDIVSITGVGNSSKDSGDITTIGKFGVGFKSVFAVTEKPHIYSTTYNFQIENLSVPSEIPGRDLGDFTTIFQLDFKSEGRDMFFSRNEKLLREILPETILFLKNICNVEVEIEDELLPEVSLSREEGDALFHRVVYEQDGQTVELLKFSKKGLSIVYLLKDGIVTPVKGSKISVFFPTIIDSSLSFMIDAPFQTSTTRESIDFELPYNIEIVEMFGELFTQSISKLKALGLYTASLFNSIMPVEEAEELEDFPVYKKLSAVFQEAVRVQSLVPTNHGELLPAPQVLLASESEIIELLEHIPNLNFVNKKLSTASVALTKRAGAGAFSSLSIFELVEKDILKLEECSDEWLYKFYEYCLKSINNDGWNKSFIRAVKQAPIIKTRSGGFSSAYAGDSPNVFRPSKGIPEDRIIHPLFLTEAEAVSGQTKSRMKSFLNELGITERKPVIVLKEDYFNDYDKATDEEKIRIFKAAADIYKQSEPKYKAEIEEYLDQIAFVPSEQGRFKEASALYNGYNPDLKFLLGASQFDFFCSNLVSDNAEYRDFCTKLGLVNQLKIDETKNHLTNRDAFVALYNKYGSNQDYGSSTREFTLTFYHCESLREILSNPLPDGSTSRLANLLLKLNSRQLKEYLSWHYYGVKEEVVGPSEIYRLLTDTAWIEKDSQWLKPADISFDNFCELFKLPRDNVLQALEWSNDNIIEQLSDREQEAIKLMRELDLSPEEMHELRQATLEKRKKQQRLEKNIAVGIENTDSDITAEPDSGDDIEEDDTPLQLETEAGTLMASEVFEAEETNWEGTVTTHVGAETDQSNVVREERQILKNILENYKNDSYTVIQDEEDREVYTVQKDTTTLKVLLLPKNSSGYNIEISENDKIIEAIAVIKADLDKKKFAISEAQWDLAKRDDIKYSLHLVSRQGDSMSQTVINNLRDGVRDRSIRAVPGVIYY